MHLLDSMREGARHSNPYTRPGNQPGDTVPAQAKSWIVEKITTLSVAIDRKDDVLYVRKIFLGIIDVVVLGASILFELLVWCAIRNGDRPWPAALQSNKTIEFTLGYDEQLIW